MNIVLIGLGMVADTHVNAIRASDRGLNLAGVLGRNKDRIAAFAARHKAHAYRSLQEVVESKDIDFAILATPPDAIDAPPTSRCPADLPKRSPPPHQWIRRHRESVAHRQPRI